MAGSNRRIVIEFLGKDSGLGREVDSVQSKTGSLGGKLKKFGKVAALGFAAAATGAVVVGKKLIDAGERAGTANARIENIAESMGLFGEQSDEVAKRLVKLAEKTALQTGMDQNAIKETQAKLLTFKDLAKSADEVGGAFDRATAAAVDMEAAGFGSASQNAVQLGKALNDPIKGITALARSGITFNEVEKERIKTLVESGKQGKAQAMILKAIETQVQGTAAATANGTDRIKVAFSQVAEKVGTALVPAVDKVATWFVDKGLPAMARFGNWAQDNLIPIFNRVRTFIGKALDGLRGDSDGTFKKLRTIIANFVTVVTKLWDRFGKDLLAILRAVWRTIGGVLKGALSVLNGLFKVFAGVLKGDWRQVWSGVKDILRGAWQAITAIVRGAFSVLKSLMRAAWNTVKDIVRGAWDGIKTIVRNGADRLLDGIRAIPGRIRNVAGAFAGAGRAIIGAFVDGLKNAAGVVSGIAGNVWSAVKSMINGAIRRINSALSFTIKLPGPDLRVSANIPYLAKGGVVKARPGGTLAVLGEAGADEAVIPLSGPHAPAGLRTGASGSEHLGTFTLDLKLDGRTMQKVLLKLKRDSGGLELGIA